MTAELFWIALTALATVGILGATIWMVNRQVKAQENANKISLTMRMIERYDDMREERKALAIVLENGGSPGAVTLESVADHLDTIAVLHKRKLLDDDLIENVFSVPIRFWWQSVKYDVTNMRIIFNDFYEDFEYLSDKYDAMEKARGKDPTITQEALSNFLMSELQS